jgi:GxxExxY protein
VEQEGPKGRSREFADGSAEIVGALIEVHRHLGPGLLESAYDVCFQHELRLRGIPFERQIPVPVAYKGALLGVGYQLDFFVGGHFIVELKAVAQMLPIHIAQVLTYMRLTNTKVGFLVNFNETILKRGLRRLELDPRGGHGEPSTKSFGPSALPVKILRE